MFTYNKNMDVYKNKLVSFYQRQRRMPSYSEMLALFGYRSKNAVHKLVGRLIADGFIKKDRQGRLLPHRFFGSVRLLGDVQAGFPSPAEEELADTITLDDYLIKNREATFMLKVSGDSMIDAGIQPGDLALVERTATVKPGDIVIAEVDNEWTMKFYRTRAGKIFLEAANKKYPPIYPQEQLNIAAVVKAVIRKY